MLIAVIVIANRTRNVVGRLIRLVMDTMLLPTVVVVGVTVMYLVYVSPMFGNSGINQITDGLIVSGGCGWETEVVQLPAK
jgi:hypothetical protein